jgi:hypothetical protein
MSPCRCRNFFLEFGILHPNTGLVFCPYNYLISPVVRRAMDIDISGSIIILDEAQ